MLVHGLNKGFKASVDTWGTNLLGTALHEKYPKSRIITCNYLSDDPRISPFTMEGLRSHAMEILNDLLDWCKRKEMEEVCRPEGHVKYLLTKHFTRMEFGLLSSSHMILGALLSNWYDYVYLLLLSVSDLPAGSLDSIARLWQIQKCVGFD